MSPAALAQPAESSAPSTARGATLSPDELAELLTAFNEVTGKLQKTHETLRSEVARLEAELSESREQLRRARHLAALGEMAAGIAHEVRNPLGSIRLYAQVLAEDLADRPQQCDVARKISSAVTRLDSVVGDVLLFARERPLQLAGVPVTELADDAIDACRELLNSHGIVIERDIPAGLELHADAGLMHQAVLNLIRNAAEAIGESSAALAKKEIRIAARGRRLLNAEGRREPLVSLTIRDSGPGFPAEHAERIFDPFFTTRHTGTGLGLAIVHRIIDAHGGRIAIRNNPPGEPGACVEILIPETPGESAGSMAA